MVVGADVVIGPYNRQSDKLEFEYEKEPANAGSFLRLSKNLSLRTSPQAGVAIS